MEATSPTTQEEAEGLEHLRWLNGKDQQVLFRGLCATTASDDAKLLRDIRVAMTAHGSAIEHCCVVSEADPDWFTLDVRDSHSRKIQILANALAELEADTVPLPENAAITDGLRSRIYSSYARTAQVSSRVAVDLHENVQQQVQQQVQQVPVQRMAEQGQLAADRLAEQGQLAADAARSAFGTVSSRLSGFGSNRFTHDAAAERNGTAAAQKLETFLGDSGALEGATSTSGPSANEAPVQPPESVGDTSPSGPSASEAPVQPSEINGAAATSAAGSASAAKTEDCR